LSTEQLSQFNFETATVGNNGKHWQHALARQRAILKICQAALTNNSALLKFADARSV
jgi:hypothetical protein